MLNDDIQKQIDEMLGNGNLNQDDFANGENNNDDKQDEFLAEENENQEKEGADEKFGKELEWQEVNLPEQEKQEEQEQKQEQGREEAIVSLDKNNDQRKEEAPEENNKEIIKEENFFHEIGKRNEVILENDERNEELDEKMKELELGRKEEEQKTKALAQGLGYINLKGLPIVPEALRVIDENESREKKVICFMYKGGREMRLATVDYNREIEELVADLKGRHEGMTIGIYLTSEKSMEEAIARYAALPKIEERVDDVEVLEGDINEVQMNLVNLQEIEEKIKAVPVTKALSVIIVAAIKIEASDIHIEAEEKGIKLRYRIDGVLHDVAEIEKESWNKIISRIKLAAGLKINIKDRPQDGRFSTHLMGKAYDFRVSSLPTDYGESIVIRILYQEKLAGMNLDNLGIGERNRRILEREITKPNGMIVVTGPTGSGKTTTLYAVLIKLNSPSNKIITVEDPIEYRIQGINQSEVNEGRGYTFAKALRSVVRQDPDIILIGEIRDKETVEIALNAALTGHLVFSTIHTNDAAGTIARFLSLGAKAYLLSPALNIAVAQRLVRKICGKCKKEKVLNEMERQRVKEEIEKLPDSYEDKFKLDVNKLKFYEGGGCDECSGLGYKGQIGIFEILELNSEIRKMILEERVSEVEIREAGIRGGMITMRQDGILKAIEGITSLEEVFRVS
jgi:type IV pilus assembly protein PilB